MKIFEILFSLPDNLAKEADLNKSLGFHRFMRHARECHKNLLEFMMQNGLLSETGGSELIANERKTLLECSENVALKLRTLPFVEQIEPRADIDQSRTIRQRAPVTSR